MREGILPVFFIRDNGAPLEVHLLSKLTVALFYHGILINANVAGSSGAADVLLRDGTVN